jgi:hypothetical protein
MHDYHTSWAAAARSLRLLWLTASVCSAVSAALGAEMPLVARSCALDTLLPGLVAVTSSCARNWSSGAKSTRIAERARLAGCLNAVALERASFAELARPVSRVAIRASFALDLVDGSCGARVPWRAVDAPQLAGSGLMSPECAQLLRRSTLCAACARSALNACRRTLTALMRASRTQ